MTTLVTILVSFVAATSLAVAVILATVSAQSSPQARIRRRLASVSPSSTLLLETGGLAKTSAYSTIPGFHRVLSQSSYARNLDLLLDRANLNLSVGMFSLLSLLTASLGFVLLSFNQPAGIAVLGGALAGTTPYLYVQYLARLRMRRFLEQLPDGLDIMAQGLQAGLGLTQAQVYVAKEMPDPLGAEFSIFMEELNLVIKIPYALIIF
jgi:tight adherence protein B